MKYAALGNTGLEVSRLGFGAMRLLTDADGNWDIDGTVEIIRRAFDHGVNFIDSQYHYCGDQSEPCIGRAVQGRRDQTIIQTKACYYDLPSYAQGETHRSRLEETLRRLRTDYIDIYLMHSVRLERWQEFGEDWMQMALKARDEGLIRHIGLSSHETPENVKTLLDMGCFEVILMQYNLLDLRYGEMFAYAREKGLGTLVMGPVGGGRLAGPSQELLRDAPDDVKTSAELALRFVLSNPNVDCALSGMRSLGEADENCSVASLDEPLSQEARQRTLAMVAEKGKLADLYCSGCNYCSPCPHGVAISQVFSAMAMHEVWGLTEAARGRYARLGPDSTAGLTADACQECGECEPKCPQDIPIRERLKEAREAFGSS